MQDLLLKISIYTPLIPILVFLIFFKKIKEIPIWVIFLYSLYSFINDQIMVVKVDAKKDVSLFLYYFTLFEYISFSVILYFFITHPIVKKILIAVSIVFSLFCLYIIHFEKINDFDSLQTSIECIIFILICLFFLYEQLIKPQIEFLHSNYKVWVVITLLLYLGGAFFLFAFAVYLPAAERQKYWPILLLSNIVKNILFAIAVYISTRPRDDYYDDYLYEQYDKIDD